MSGRLGSPALGAWVIAACHLAGCAWTDEPSAAEIEACARDEVPPAGLVGRDAEGRFVASSEVFVPRGIGSYPLLEHAGNGRMDEVHDIFDQALALGRPLVRTNAFFDGSDNAARIRDADGTLREEGLVGLDRLLAAAAERGVRLVLVLTNNWTDYGGAEAVLGMVAPGEDLPKDAFWSDPRAVAAQRRYLETLVGRTNTVNGRSYAADDTVFAWELVNEARCTDAGRCDADTLVDWAREMSDAIRGAGATQLVAWGGAGHRGEHGEDLGAVADSGAVDVLTLHVWPFASRSLHLDGRASAERASVGIRVGADAIRDRAALARRHRLPLLVEEMGWRHDGRADRDGERGLVLGAWLSVARGEGVGALPWMIGERGRPDYDGLLIRPDSDPATVEALRCE